MACNDGDRFEYFNECNEENRHSFHSMKNETKARISESEEYNFGLKLLHLVPRLKMMELYYYPAYVLVLN
jgi:hypothetical protein